MGEMVELQKIENEFTICKLGSVDGVDFAREFVFLSKTDDEISLVCESAYVPPDVVASESGWRGLKISGVLDFGMVGVIAKITTVLAEAGISVFVVSTYNTDYIFVKTENFEKTTQVLLSNSYSLI